MFERVRRILATLLTLAHTRLELATVELEEEVRRLTAVVLLAIVAIACAGFAVLLLALTVVIAFWDDHRLLAAGLVTALFAAGALAAGLAVRTRLANRPRLLSATIGELKRDARALQGEP
jgi:uncharacterized membrane protein YqjE